MGQVIEVDFRAFKQEHQKLLTKGAKPSKGDGAKRRKPARRAADAAYEVRRRAHAAL